MAGGRHLNIFCVGAAALVLAALSFTSEGDPSHRGSAVVAPLAPASPPSLGGRSRGGAQLRRDAHEFVANFLKYEAGRLSRPVQRALRAGATKRFATELLQAPPRVDAPLAPAHIGRLFIEDTSWGRALAVVAGSAKRGAERENFSFLFVRSGGMWLAGGPAP
jgi:hypothetical protein